MQVLVSEFRLEDWHLCRSCRGQLKRGFHRTTPEGAFEPYVDGRGLRFTEPQIRSYITAGLQPDAEWRRLVGGKLRAIGVELEEAVAANDRYDWRDVLEAVRMIQGTAVITRAALERMLGPDMADAGLPPLAHAGRAVGLLISEGEIDSLPPDEVRARMRRVLQALDRELKTMLSPPDGPSTQ